MLSYLRFIWVDKMEPKSALQSYKTPRTYHLLNLRCLRMPRLAEQYPVSSCRYRRNRLDPRSNGFFADTSRSLLHQVLGWIPPRDLCWSSHRIYCLSCRLKWRRRRSGVWSGSCWYESHRWSRYHALHLSCHLN
jgi:hypothetical protein